MENLSEEQIVRDEKALEHAVFLDGFLEAAEQVTKDYRDRGRNITPGYDRPAAQMALADAIVWVLTGTVGPDFLWAFQAFTLHEPSKEEIEWVENAVEKLGEGVVEARIKLAEFQRREKNQSD